MVSWDNVIDERENEISEDISWKISWDRDLDRESQQLVLDILPPSEQIDTQGGGHRGQCPLDGYCPLGGHSLIARARAARGAKYYSYAHDALIPVQDVMTQGILALSLMYEFLRIVSLIHWKVKLELLMVDVCA